MNQINKRILALEKTQLEEYNDIDNEEQYEELSELILMKNRLIARTKSDEEDGEEDFTSIAYSTKIWERILRFLQLLCENHNIKLQDHLREQNNRDGVSLGKTFNFPTFISNMMGMFAKEANIHIMDLGSQLIETLIELVQGPCRGNQTALITAKIIDNARDFIANYQGKGFDNEMKSKGLDMNDEEHVEMIDRINHLLVTLLLGLLEGTPDNNIISRMSHSLDFSLMKERMYHVYKKFVVDLMKLKTPRVENIINIPEKQIKANFSLDSLDDSGIMEGFDIYILLQSLADNSKFTREQLGDETFTLTQKKAYKFFQLNCASIEVNLGDYLQLTYFPIRPICNELNGKMKDKFIFGADRSSPSEKIRSLMNESKAMIKDMTAPKSGNLIRNISTFLAIVINILLLIFFRLEDGLRKIEIDPTAKLIIDIISGFQIFLALLMVVLYFRNQGGLIIRHSWESYIQNERARSPDYQEELDEIYEKMGTKVEDLTVEQTLTILFYEGPDAKKFNEDDEKREFGNFVTAFQYYLLSLCFLCTNGLFIYYLFYCTISVCGLVLNPVYVSFLLLDIIIRYETLGNVIQSVTKNIKSLMMTLILILIILYIYACIGFFFFHDMLYTYEINIYDSDTIGESMCDYMFQCYVSMINLGLRNGGGIGDAVKPESYDNKIEYYSKFFFNFTFHLIVIVVMLNIVFGIVIDTFAQIRNENKAAEMDQRNKCYICNIDRYIFDQDGDGFEDHCENDHNMWNYIFYIIHLQRKDPTEYSGLESYVWEKYEEEDISWLPLHKAIKIDMPNQEDAE